EIVARLRVKDAEADRRRRLNVWVIATLADPQFVDSPVGPWTQGGCYLLALAIRDALAVHGVASELAEYKPPNHSGSQHVAVAMGLTRLDAYGAWLAGVPPAALAGWTESLLDAAKAAGWGSPFDDEAFRARPYRDLHSPEAGSRAQGCSSRNGAHVRRTLARAEATRCSPVAASCAHIAGAGESGCTRRGRAARRGRREHPRCLHAIRGRR